MANADLRPMTIGEVLDRMFRLYKDQFWLFTGIMSLPFLVLLIVNIGLAWLSRMQIFAARSGTGPHAAATFLWISVGGGLLVLALTFVVTGIGQAATIFAVSDLYLSRPGSIHAAYGKVRGHVLQALGVIFLSGLIVGTGAILLIIPGIILMCRLAVAVPTAMLEDSWPGTAISRSMNLTKGFGMQVFLIFLLTWALAFGTSMVTQLPFTILAATPRPHILPLSLIVLQDVFRFVGQVVVAPVGAIAFCLMYYNLRVHKEAFDLEHLMISLDSGSTAGEAAPGTATPS